MLSGGQACNAQDTIPDYECTIDIPNFFTPNGDGINDEWVINGLECYDVELNVYDRNGLFVYKYLGHRLARQHFWNGFSERGNIMMPNGVYFYRLYLSSG